MPASVVALYMLKEQQLRNLKAALSSCEPQKLGTRETAPVADRAPITSLPALFVLQANVARLSASDAKFCLLVTCRHFQLARWYSLQYDLAHVQYDLKSAIESLYSIFEYFVLIERFIQYCTVRKGLIYSLQIWRNGCHLLSGLLNVRKRRLRVCSRELGKTHWRRFPGDDDISCSWCVTVLYV